MLWLHRKLMTLTGTLDGIRDARALIQKKIDLVAEAGNATDYCWLCCTPCTAGYTLHGCGHRACGECWQGFLRSYCLEGGRIPAMCQCEGKCSSSMVWRD